MVEAAGLCEIFFSRSAFWTFTFCLFLVWTPVKVSQHQTMSLSISTAMTQTSPESHMSLFSINDKEQSHDLHHVS
ncbi:hypothetical protein ATANTOWER_025066 [Ataeniobius toweri]|uniref:Uncharacterized protein n=1 Tax=Ataeniobius toweri TaxID=208326 RepID=A0ABU7AQX6_9TELE|nr:hypothetical protein [Ataeniobius toweri]